MPIGESILWPENAKKSQSMSRTSTFMCATLCEPSTTATAPTLCAFLTIFLTSFLRPRTFETCVTATIFVFSVIFVSMSSSERLPSFSR